MWNLRILSEIKRKQDKDFVCLSVEIEKSSFLELEKLHHELG